MFFRRFSSNCSSICFCSCLLFVGFFPQVRHTNYAYRTPREFLTPSGGVAFCIRGVAMLGSGHPSSRLQCCATTQRCLEPQPTWTRIWSSCPRVVAQALASSKPVRMAIHIIHTHHTKACERFSKVNGRANVAAQLQGVLLATILGHSFIFCMSVATGYLTFRTGIPLPWVSHQKKADHPYQ